MSLQETYNLLKENAMRAQGIKHIKYTKSGVPFPDWDKILKEALYDENGKIKKVNVRIKESDIIPNFEALEICRDAKRVELISGINHYDGGKMYCDFSYVYHEDKKYFVIRDCGKIVFCKQIKKESSC